MSNGIIGVSSAEAARYTLFHATLNNLKRPDGTLTTFASSANIAQNRNEISNFALTSGADWVLYLDDDHILRDDTLLRLLAADKDVISAHYVQRQKPFNSVVMDAELPGGAGVWKQLNPTEKGIISCTAVGAGCLLVKRTVLEALKPPYWTLGQIHPGTWGDDLDFCNRIRKAGFEIHVDLDNYIGHLMTTMVWPTRSDAKGWVANIAQATKNQLLLQEPMPLPGEFYV